jgi:mannosyltransferase
VFAERPVRGWVRWLLLVLLLAAFALRLYELTRQDIWWDEARNIDVALRPLLQVATAPELDIHPPVYFWLLHFWTQLTGIAPGQEPISVAFATRFLSVIAGVIGVALLYPLAERAGGALAGLCAITIGALAPFWLAESQETRMYTVGFALLAGAALALMNVTRSQGPSNIPTAPIPQSQNLPISESPNRPLPYRSLVVFVLLSALALLNHYNAVFILVAWYLWWGGWALLQPDRWRQTAVVFVSGLAMTLLVLPVAPIALRQIPGYANPNLRIPSVAEYLGENARAYLGGYAFDGSLLAGAGTAWLWLTLALLLLGLLLSIYLGFLLRYSLYHHRRLKNLTLLLVWLLGGLALYYIAVLDRGAFNVRYSSFVTPALYALAGTSLAALGAVWRPLPAVGLALLLLGLIPGIRADLTDPRFARENISGVTDWLREVAGPNDVIFVDQKYPFGFYYERYAIDEAAAPVGREAAPARYLFVDINTLDERLNEWASEAETVYWVQWFESDTDPRRAVPFLLDQAGVRGGEKSYQGYSIDWWELTPPNRFALEQTFVEARHAWPPAVETVEIALPDGPIAAGETAFAAIRWQRAGSDALGRPLKARVALYDVDGSRKAQADERILNDRHLLPDEWSGEDQPLNVYRVATPPDLAPGLYEIRLLVYDADTLEPLGLVDEAGNPVGVEAVIGEVEIHEHDGD